MPDPQPRQRVGICGLGAMGAGLAQRCVQEGAPATVRSRRAEALDPARERIEAACRLAVRRKRAQAEAVDAGLDELRLTTELADLTDCALVVEAIEEDFAAKTALLAALARALPAATTLATNTSSLSVARLAQDSGAQGRLVGMHFMNPVPESRLVELVAPTGAEEAHVSRARVLAAQLGLQAITAADVTGFVVNRALMPLIAEAIRALEARVASARDIDTALRLGCGHPLGPLALADLIGLDVVLAELRALEQAHGPRFAPPALLEDLVARGDLGRKTGAGLHRYARRA